MRNRSKGDYMIFVPILEETLCRITENGFLFKRDDNSLINPTDPDIEGSHIHDFYEIYINFSGDVSFLHDRNVYCINPGDIIFSKPGEFHYCIYHSVQKHEHCCIWFDVSEASDITKYIERHDISGHIRPEKNITSKIASIIKELETSQDRFEKTALFMNLLTYLKKGDSEEAPSIPVKLRGILKYIDEHYTDIRFLEDVANKYHISTSTMNRWFRTYLNLSPTTLITAKKMAYAEKLLMSDNSVTEACFMSGFTDCSRFIRAFRKTYGMTPLKYKKSKQKATEKYQKL